MNRNWFDGFNVKTHWLGRTHGSTAAAWLIAAFAEWPCSEPLTATALAALHPLVFDQEKCIHGHTPVSQYWASAGMLEDEYPVVSSTQSRVGPWREQSFLSMVIQWPLLCGFRCSDDHWMLLLDWAGRTLPVTTRAALAVAITAGDCLNSKLAPRGACLTGRVLQSRTLEIGVLLLSQTPIAQNPHPQAKRSHERFVYLEELEQPLLHDPQLLLATTYAVNKSVDSARQAYQRERLERLLFSGIGGWCLEPGLCRMVCAYACDVGGR